MNAISLLDRVAGGHARFFFSVNSANALPGSLRVYAFKGTESVCRPYEFEIELASRQSNIDLMDYIGKTALLAISDNSGGTRLVHGLIQRMDQLHTANLHVHYRCCLVPRLYFLQLTQDQRIYQHLSVPEIIAQLLSRHGFTAEDFAFELFFKYSAREYCVQYGESDLHFLTRICEEEGIFFYFEHRENAHVLRFSDMPGGRKIPGESALIFHPGAGTVQDTAVITRWNSSYKANSNAGAYAEWNFTRPSLDLSASIKAHELDNAPVPQGMLLETYQFPHLYQTQKDGNRYMELQLQRQLTFRRWAVAESDVSRFMPGYTFSMLHNPRSEDNRGWWVAAAALEGEQPGVLEHEAPDRGVILRSKITVIPDNVRYVPEIEHKKIRIIGLQSAIVTGPSGEEVFTDEYGRVKVQFHWDRLGQKNENTTCWVRVGSQWAGAHFGTVHTPRIGQEVLVEFMEGDPDRPVITGRAYNKGLMPPWDLPSQKALSGIQSREFNGTGRNQLVMDDTTGHIQLQLSSDYQSTGLSMGHIARINHVRGRMENRGEGFELRTEGWGVMRAGKGLVITAYDRPGLGGHQKDLQETAAVLDEAVEQHKKTCGLAVEHNAQEQSSDPAIAERLQKQRKAVGGSGRGDEMSAPQIVLTTPSGMVAAAGETMHLHSGADMGVTVRGSQSTSVGENFLLTALSRISLFAHKMGVKLFAGRGKVEIQAQSAEMDLVAKKQITISSEGGKVHISSPDEIILSAGGSFITINASGITEGTKGKWQVFSGSRDMSGPKDMKPLEPVLPSAGIALNQKPREIALALIMAPGHPPLAHEKFTVYANGRRIAQGYTDENGHFGFPHDPAVTEYELETFSGRQRVILNVREEYGEGVQGLKERLAAEGSPLVLDAAAPEDENLGVSLWERFREKNAPENAREEDS